MKTIISTEKAPQAIGPYSQGVEANGFVFFSGQIPLDPETMKMVEGDVTVQAEQVMQNVKAMLEAAGLDFSNVVKTTMFLSDMENFAKANEVYAKYFTENQPARSTLQVARLPLDALVEVECIAVKN